MVEKSGSADIDAVVETLQSLDVPIPHDLDVIARQPGAYAAALKDLDASRLLQQIRVTSEWVSALQRVMPEIQSRGLVPAWMRLFQTSNSAIFAMTREMNSRIAEAMAPISAVAATKAAPAKKAATKAAPTKKAATKAAPAKKAATKAAPAKKAATKAAPAKKATTTKRAAKASQTRTRDTTGRSSAGTAIRGKKTPKKPPQIKPVKPQPGTAWGRKK